MVGRRGGMGIVGVAATAKVVNNRAQARAEQQAAQQAAPAATPEAPAAPAGDDLVAQLEKLAGLKASGVLSEEEFAAAKAKLIAGS
jgi:membrane protease subunit (stomatin/prohibitin family)